MFLLFLAEPASYTVDRNLKVYVPMGIDYCYLLGNSEAKKYKRGEGKGCVCPLFEKATVEIYTACA